MLILFSRDLLLAETFIMSVLEQCGKLIFQKISLFLYCSNICMCCGFLGLSILVHLSLVFYMVALGDWQWACRL